MMPHWKSFLTLALIFSTSFSAPVLAASNVVSLQLGSVVSNRAALSWHSRLQLPVSTMFPEYQVQYSVDLVHWTNIDGAITGGVGVSEQDLRALLPPGVDRAFYRILTNIRFAEGSPGGDAVFGYGTALARELSRIGEITASQFSSRYRLTNTFLQAVAFNPTLAAYWDRFSADPAVWNQTNAADPRYYDYRLNTNEMNVLRKNGFVVSERLGTHSFAEAFYRLYMSDLPVFISADSVLHAWHRSYVTMLEEVEVIYLAPELKRIYDGMALGIPALWQANQTGPLRDSILDADFFIAVARSLLEGASVSSILGQDVRVTEALNAIAALEPVEFPLFGTNRMVDFSQFRVRGHYEGSSLSNYFQAQMWSGRIDFRVAEDPDSHTERELGAAIVLHALLTQAGLFDAWLKFDQTLQVFVGVTDSMTFAQLSDLLHAAGINSLADLPDRAALTNLQEALITGGIGVQDIRSDYLPAPLFGTERKLPRSFTVTGQKFVVDSWALSKLVFDSIRTNKGGMDVKVNRRLPSCIDVAFSILGNSHVVPELVARILLDASSGLTFRQFRDGLPYQHNLAAVRNVVDAHSPDFWTNNIYMGWLASLRALSAPTTDPQYPQAMRTRPWAMKTLNTQMASWTELRHDTVLYAKQSYTGPIICDFPEGYVEARPEFWRQMSALVQRSRDLIATLPASGTVVVVPPGSSMSFTMDLYKVRTNRLAFMDNFLSTLTTLESIATKHLGNTPLTGNEIIFLKDVIERHDDYYGKKQYTGWYPRLFYKTVFQMVPYYTELQGSDAWDALVTDVHTDTPDLVSGDPGAILHQGVGAVHLLLIVVDRGSALTAFAGPVLSHYEFDLGPTTRMTDSEWKANVQGGVHPPQPDWTRSYLVPGTLILSFGP